MKSSRIIHGTLLVLIVCFPFNSLTAQERHVQSSASNPIWNGDGSPGAPFQNVIEGVLDVSPGGSVLIRSGTYAEKMFIKKPMQLRASGGPATIGTGVPAGFITCDGPMRADEDGDWIDDACEELLAQKYAPIIYHSSDESNFPTNVDWFLQRTSLWFFDDACDPGFFDPFRTDLDVFVTALPTQAHLLIGSKNNECDTDFFDVSSGTRSNRKHRTFYLPDVDEAFRKGSDNSQNWKTYYHAYPTAGGGVVIQYWRFYAYNDYQNNHGGDWEGVQVHLGTDLRPRTISFLGHVGIENIDAATVQWEGTHPRVYSEPGGHASQSFPYGGGDSFTRQETWAGGNVSWTRNVFNHPVGQTTLGGGLVNVGAKIAPMNGQYFIRYSGLWGSISDFPIDQTIPTRWGDLNARTAFSGYWGPAYNETGAGEFERDSPPRFLPAWGAGAAQTHLLREWQATSTSP